MVPNMVIWKFYNYEKYQDYKSFCIVTLIECNCLGHQFREGFSEKNPELRMNKMTEKVYPT